MRALFTNCFTHYVDDIIAGGQTEEETFKVYAQSKEIFREGGFNLKKFLTNSKPLQEQIDFQESQKVDSRTIQLTQRILSQTD